MNSDYNFTPSQQSNPQQTEPRPATPATPSAEASRPAQVITSSKKGGTARKFWKFLALLFLLALIGAIGYILHQKHISSLEKDRAQLQQQVGTLQSQLNGLEKSDEQPAATPDSDSAATKSTLAVVTGSTSTVTADNVMVSVLYQPGTVEEIWVEAGTRPDALTLSSKHLRDGLGAGSENQYSDKSFGLTDLKPGTRYFYRAAAKVKGQTVYGGVSSFVTTK